MEYHKKVSQRLLTWRTIATFTTMAIVYLFTGNLNLITGVGIFDVGFKLFFSHERI